MPDLTYESFARWLRTQDPKRYVYSDGLVFRYCPLAEWMTHEFGRPAVCQRDYWGPVDRGSYLRHNFDRRLGVFQRQFDQKRFDSDNSDEWPMSLALAALDEVEAAHAATA